LYICVFYVPKAASFVENKVPSRCYHKNW